MEAAIGRRARPIRAGATIVHFGNARLVRRRGTERRRAPTLAADILNGQPETAQSARRGRMKAPRAERIAAPDSIRRARERQIGRVRVVDTISGLRPPGTIAVRDRERATEIVRNRQVAVRNRQVAVRNRQVAVRNRREAVRRRQVAVRRRQVAVRNRQAVRADRGAAIRAAGLDLPRRVRMAALHRRVPGITDVDRKEDRGLRVILENQEVDFPVRRRVLRLRPTRRAAGKREARASSADAAETEEATTVRICLTGVRITASCNLHARARRGGPWWSGRLKARNRFMSTLL